MRLSLFIKKAQRKEVHDGRIKPPPEDDKGKTRFPEAIRVRNNTIVVSCLRLMAPRFPGAGGLFRQAN